MPSRGDGEGCALAVLSWGLCEVGRTEREQRAEVPEAELNCIKTNWASTERAGKPHLGGLQVRGSGVEHDTRALEEEEVRGLSSVAEG